MAKKLLRAALLVTFLSVLTRILSFLFRIYLSRTIGAENLGIYQIALSVFFLFSTLTAGLPLTVSRKTAELKVLSNNDREKSILSSSLILGISISASVVLVLYLFSSHLSFLFSDERCLPLFLILLPSCISTSVYGIIRGWFWGNQKFSIFSFTEFFECIIRISLGVLLVSGVIAGASGAYGTALSFTISDVLCTVILCILFVYNGGKLGKPRSFKEISKTAIPLTAVRLYSSFINSIVAIIVPARLVAYGMDSSLAVTEFGRAMGMAIPLLMSPSTLTGAIATVLVPELAALKASNETAELKRKSENSIILAIICAFLFMVIFLPLGREIGVLFYGDEIAGNYISYASVIMLPMSISGISSTMLDSLGLELKTMRNYVIGSILMLIMLFISPYFAGTYSIAIGLGTSYLTSTILNLAVLKRRLNLSIKKFIEVLISVGITTGVCSYGAIFVKNLTKSLPLLINIIIPAVFSVILFGTVVLLYGYIDVEIFTSRTRKSKNTMRSITNQ